MRMGKSRRSEMSAGKKSSADAPQPQPGQGRDPRPCGSGVEPTGACLAQVAAGSGECHRSLSHPRPAGVSCPVPTPSSLEPAGFELPTHIKGHKFGLGFHKFDSINISFRRV